MLQAVHLMRAWFLAHKTYPYPDAKTKRRLALEGGLALKQTTNWVSSGVALHAAGLSSFCDVWFVSSPTREGTSGCLNRSHVSGCHSLALHALALTACCNVVAAGRGGKHARSTGTLREAEFNAAAAAEDANAARATRAGGSPEVEVVEEVEEGAAGEAGGDDYGGGDEGDGGEV